MNTSFSTWAIRNPIPPIVLFLMLTLGGLYQYMQLPVNNMPAVVVPIVEISISAPGASPREIETQITRKVESALSGIQGVKHIKSTITEGSSSTTVEFTIETLFDRAMADARDAVASIRDTLPRNIYEPLLKRVEIEGGPILVYSVVAPHMRPETLAWYIDDTLSRELLSVKGVAQVTRGGGVNHEITVALDPVRMAAYGMSAADVSRVLARNNLDMPGGHLIVGSQELQIRTAGNTDTLAALQDYRFTLPAGQAVRLGDIATITDGGAEARSVTRLDGKAAVTFSVYRSKGSSEISVAKLVEKKLQVLAEQRKDVQLAPIFSLVEFTEVTFKSAIYTFFEGAVLTVFIVFLFLRDMRATLIAAVTIPLSIIPTFMVMRLFDFSLNGVSLLAISLVTGVLVDDAIVEIENVHRHMRMGKKPLQAAMQAVNEIGLAVIATTLVICAVFMPISFMGGVVGQYFRQFGLTVATAAMFSLLVARLITPLLAAYFLQAPPEEHIGKVSSLSLRYQALVRWTLDHRWTTVALAILSLFLAFGMIPYLSTGLFPYEDYSQSIANVETPRGSTLEQTDAATQRVVQILKQRPEVDYVLSSVGQAAGGINRATLMIKLLPRKQRALDQRAFEAATIQALQQLPDIRVAFANAWGMKDVSIALLSDDLQALQTAARNVEREMRGITGLASVTNSASQQQPELVVVPDFAKAAQLGVSVEAINDAISVAMIGDLDTQLAKFNYGAHQIPIRVRLPRQNGNAVAMLQNLRVSTNGGISVPLSTVVSLRYDVGPTQLDRYDRQRKVALEANLAGIPLGDALAKINALPSMQQLPTGVTMQNTGDAEMMDDLFKGFSAAIIAGLLMVYAIQVLLYKDWLHPLTRMAALPLSIGGAFFMLLVTGTEMNMPALIGILMLMGIADKNAILLVDHMLVSIKNGMPTRDAIVLACSVRARPILMTSLAMLAGMLPVAFHLGLDTGFRAPMAIAVIGGLISSTLLSLVFVPVFFSLMEQFSQWLRPKLARSILQDESIISLASPLANEAPQAGQLRS